MQQESKKSTVDEECGSVSEGQEDQEQPAVSRCKSPRRRRAAEEEQKVIFSRPVALLNAFSFSQSKPLSL